MRMCIIYRVFVGLLIGSVVTIVSYSASTIQVSDLYEVGQSNVVLTTRMLPSPLAGEGLGVRGKITNQYLYSPYGSQKNLNYPVSLNSPRPQAGEGVGERVKTLINQTRKPLNITHNKFGYTGQAADPSTGLMMLGGFRNYAPGIGRFIQPDTYNSFSKHSITNPMAYVNANPVALTDPKGHFSVPLLVGGIVSSFVGSVLLGVALGAIDHNFQLQWSLSSIGGLLILSGLTAGIGGVFADGAVAAEANAGEEMKEIGNPLSSDAEEEMAEEEMKEIGNPLSPDPGIGHQDPSSAADPFGPVVHSEGDSTHSSNDFSEDDDGNAVVIIARFPGRLLPRPTGSFTPPAEEVFTPLSSPTLLEGGESPQPRVFSHGDEDWSTGSATPSSRSRSPSQVS